MQILENLLIEANIFNMLHLFINATTEGIFIHLLF